ncbi:MAG: tRNA (N(6)-L-threonylcarbamoyladenosine(37)-C(2))-methylthiotransferase MtaB [Clostridiales bacterium]|nr:tRNA (N(6)-L-threonylcarbamoyladenosine(37)-C(2))-methylthiotransferase MtaB [Clostridiales bacterium]
MNFYIHTFGCKVNQYESEYIALLLENSGFKRVFEPKADIIIINSCTVTSTGDNKACKYMRRMRRENPDSVIVLTGCMTQAFPDEDYPEADIVLGNYSRKQVADAVSRFLISHTKIVDIKPHKATKGEAFEPMAISRDEEHTRAFVKIEDGCNRFCSYCIIPYARGRVRSKSIEDLKEEIQGLAESGYKEIVLVGINLSCYGQDIGLTLCDAVECACAAEGIERVRLSSLEPELMDDEAIKRLAKQEKLCPQFHLALQSGSTSVLKRMNRHYTAEEYLRIAETLKREFDNCALTTDIMTGFPGETEQEHKESMAFAEKIGFARVHCFSYSRRPGTVADKMENQLDNGLKNRRCNEMIAATDKLKKEFLKSQIGLTQTVIAEKYINGVHSGYTPNYTLVKFSSPKDICGQTVKVKLTKAFDDYVEGKLC